MKSNKYKYYCARKNYTEVLRVNQNNFQIESIVNVVKLKSKYKFSVHIQNKIKYELMLCSSLRRSSLESLTSRGIGFASASLTLIDTFRVRLALAKPMQANY